MSDHGQAPPITMPMHGLTRYLKARVEVTEGVLRWEVPRTLLGVVPLGVRRVAVAVAEVGSVRVSRTVRPLRLVAGVAIVVAPFLLGWWWAAVPMVLVGLWVTLVSLGPQLEVVTVAGARHRAAICFGHQIDAEVYIEAVNDLAQQARQ